MLTDWKRCYWKARMLGEAAISSEAMKIGRDGISLEARMLGRTTDWHTELESTKMAKMATTSDMTPSFKSFRKHVALIRSSFCVL